MEKYLITGFSGFVSGHFLQLLEMHAGKCEVLGIDIKEPSFNYLDFSNVDCKFIKVDMLNPADVSTVLEDFRPHYILHLASYSSVAYSWKYPVEAVKNNLNIFLNLVDQIRLINLDCRVLSVGSSEEYGIVNADSIPLKEHMAVNPISPYAVARVSQEQLSRIYSSGYGLNIIMTRSFNHIGPGQLDVFAIPSFVKKIIECKRVGTGFINVGNIDIVRDFIDVRDVVKAYYLLLKNGTKGEVYNICSGKGQSLREVLYLIMEALDCSVELQIDPSLIRPNDNEIIIGSHDKIKKELGWKPEISLSQSLHDIIDYWQNDND